MTPFIQLQLLPYQHLYYLILTTIWRVACIIIYKQYIRCILQFFVMAWNKYSILICCKIFRKIIRQFMRNASNVCRVFFKFENSFHCLTQIYHMVYVKAPNESSILTYKKHQIDADLTLSTHWNVPNNYIVTIQLSISWASYQIGKIAGCACAGNAGIVSPRRRFQRRPLVSDPGMHHGTCVTHVPWCMSGSLTCGHGENVPGIPGTCAPAILRIWQEVHDGWTI